MKFIILTVFCAAYVFASPLEMPSMSGLTEQAKSMAGKVSVVADHVPGVNSSALFESLEHAMNVTGLDAQTLEALRNISATDLAERLREQADNIPGMQAMQGGLAIARDTMKFAWDLARLHNETEVPSVVRKHSNLIYQLVKIAGSAAWKSASIGTGLLWG